MHPGVPSQSVFGRWFAQFSVNVHVGVVHEQPSCAAHVAVSTNVGHCAGAPVQVRLPDASSLRASRTASQLAVAPAIRQ